MGTETRDSDFREVDPAINLGTYQGVVINLDVNVKVCLFKCLSTQ